jgi:hypothetical protein
MPSRKASYLALVVVVGLTSAGCGGGPLTGPDGQQGFEVNVGSTRITNQNGNQLIVTIQQEG